MLVQLVQYESFSMSYSLRKKDFFFGGVLADTFAMKIHVFLQ